jgi:ribonuclease P protein component
LKRDAFAGIIYFYSPGFSGAIFFKYYFTISRLFTLGKQERLKSRKLIEQLFREGKSFSAFPFRIYYLYGEKIFNMPQPAFNVQAGVGVSARNFKKAVDRNRIKRLMREAYRLQKETVYTFIKERSRQLAIFIIYTGKDLPDHKIVSEKIGLTLQRLRKEIS